MKLKKHSKIKVKWRDFYYNISKGRIKDLKRKISQKYNIPQKYITIQKEYIQTSEGGDISREIDKSFLDKGKIVENYKKYFEDNYPSLDFKRFLEIDEEVAKQLPKQESKNINRKYDIQYIKGKNIFSYGQFQRDFKECNGVNLIYSDPANQGGKTSLCRVFSFLLYGKDMQYSHTKVSYNDVINKFTKGDAFIEGEIKTEDETYYLKRILKRKSNGKVSHKFYIYRYDEGFEMVSEIGKKAENLNQKDATKSLKKFKEIVGDYKDYVFSSFYESLNIEKWLTTSKLERYRLFCDYLGLSILEDKHKIGKSLNKEFKNTSWLGKYSIEEIKKENNSLEVELQRLKTSKELKSQEKESLKRDIKSLEGDILKLYDSKKPIDKRIESLKIEQTKESIINLQRDIKASQERLKSLKGEIHTLGGQTPSENELNTLEGQIITLKGELGSVSASQELLGQLKELKTSKDGIETPLEMDQTLEEYQTTLEVLKNSCYGIKAKIDTFQNQLENLPTKVVCSECGHEEGTEQSKIELSKKIENLKLEGKKEKERMLKALDKVKSYKTEIETFLSTERKRISQLIEVKEKEIKTAEQEQRNTIQTKIDSLQDQINQHNTLNVKKGELTNLESKIENLEVSVASKQKDIETYQANQDFIKGNLGINEQINTLKEKKSEVENTLEQISLEISTLSEQITLKGQKIKDNLKILDQLQKDYETEKYYKAYLEVHSPKGIAKHIINSVLPSINSSLNDLIDDDYDFDLSVRFDDKGIEFYFDRGDVEMKLYEGSGYEKTLSCLALHHVMVTMTSLPVSNNLILDEIIGRVSVENYDKLFKMLQRLAEVFDVVDIITHVDNSGALEVLKTLSDHRVKITKIENISKIV